jgi:chemotaxis protein methyltransferase CheR
MRGEGMSVASSESALRVLGGLLEARTGQQLVAGRMWRIETALRPIARELGLDGMDALVGRIVGARDKALTTRVVEALLNNESSFFRDPGVFDLLNGAGLDRLREARRDSRRLRIWSAGCSTGQEPYSIAMMLREGDARWAGWTFEIVGTDVSANAVTRAKAGRYSQFEIQRGLPVRTMLRWFTQRDDDWTIDGTLRRMVHFSEHSLLNPAPGRFDVILCRNVMMYFGAPTRAAVFSRLADALDPNGLLMLGAGETVIGQTPLFFADPKLRGLYSAALDNHRLDRRAA